ncbi:phospholipase D family protein [Emcibacter sp. SYSU 3D8]|uniref:phospholipase D family protein n=1 Tax=Emcibacter sp. SYSU 3D8 TaxID=3133969 RepID=UPI0031FE5216
MFWRNLNAHVRRHLGLAERSVVIAAPFIKVSALKRLLEAVAPAVSLSVYTRWRVDEVAAGVSDLQILDILEARPLTELGLCDELHAKLFLVDGTRALVGSANVTAAALGTSSKPNLELLQAVDMEAATAALFLADLKARSRTATREEADLVLRLAADLKIHLPPDLGSPSDAQLDDPTASDLSAGWFPEFRSPDRLYGLARDTEWLVRSAPSEAALRDLLALDVDVGGGDAAFEARVREKLRGSPMVQQLEDFLSEPRRFGAVTEWLKRLLPDANHAQRQAACQTLIRWLIYFDPERYEVGTPGAYSEVLSLKR